VRINSNPFSPEYERPGFGRIEILTKPGTDTLHGQAFGQYNKEALNSRNPLLTSPKRPQYRQDMFGFNLTGPIKKGKASYGLDAQQRSTQENAFIIATTLDSSFAPLSVNQSVLSPQSMLGISPRLDYAISTNNTLVARYQYNRQSSDKQGIGDFSLPSKAFDLMDLVYSTGKPGACRVTTPAFRLFTWTATNGIWDTNGGSDNRAFLSTRNLISGAGIISLDTGTQTVVAVDSAVVPTYLTTAAVPAGVVPPPGAVAVFNCVE
jgi:hypothetical protein